MPAPVPSSFPFDLSERSLVGPGVRTGALVITPKRPMVVGRERIAALQKPSELSEVERLLIDQAAGSGRVLLFRAVNDAGERVWSFDSSFDDADLREGGVVMTRALLPLHRHLLAAGVLLMVHTDWGLPECHAMRHGARVMAEDLESRKESSPLAALDHFILTQMLLHVALPLDHVCKRLLPNHLGLLERRQGRVDALVGALSAGVLRGED